VIYFTKLPFMKSMREIFEELEKEEVTINKGTIEKETLMIR